MHRCYSTRTLTGSGAVLVRSPSCPRRPPPMRRRPNEHQKVLANTLTEALVSRFLWVCAVVFLTLALGHRC